MTTEQTQHARDSAELRRLCNERDQLREKVAEQAREGWRLVPFEPTPEMLQAALDKPCFDPLGDLLPWSHITRTSYAAMLAAAPSAGSQKEQK